MLKSAREKTDYCLDLVEQYKKKATKIGTEYIESLKK